MIPKRDKINEGMDLLRMLLSPRGPGSSSGKVLAYGLDGPGSILGVGGGGGFSLLLCVQTGPGGSQPPIK